VFHEAWRVERDFYWDPNMTPTIGRNRRALRKRYFRGRASQRPELHHRRNDCRAEPSHTYVGGGDQPTKPHVSVGMLAADFERMAATSASRKSIPAKTGMIHRVTADRTGMKVKAGDYLIAVDGQERRVESGRLSISRIRWKTRHAENQFQVQPKARGKSP